jgi:hypothetical protein
MNFDDRVKTVSEFGYTERQARFPDSGSACDQ